MIHLCGRRVGLLIPVVAAASTALFATQIRRRLGASVEEIGAVLPGDDLLPAAQVQNDRACTITATPQDVWPWIAQLGQDKAGFYSFKSLENLVGCQISGATTIHPEWQQVAVGDPFRLHPDLALRVGDVLPGRALVVTSQGGDAPGDMDFDTTWAFVLSPASDRAGQAATRVHLRERYETRSRSTRVAIEATSVISAIMTWRMMSRLKTLAGSRRP